MTTQNGISVIIPAFNEAERISEVLRVFIADPHFKEVIVVDDGSNDETAAVARKIGARVIKNGKNEGKGHAMDYGVSCTDAQFIFFCDADIRGMTAGTITSIIEPVTAGKVDMCIAMLGRRIYDAPFVLPLTPLLGGVRVVTRDLWERVPSEFKKGFRIEAALNHYAAHGGGFQYKVCPELRQTIKERKYGAWDGVVARSRMVWEVGSAYWLLRTRLGKERG